ncbi:MAG: hypothetical protein ABH883_01070 [Candidatus Omnitrophota bacterium]
MRLLNTGIDWMEIKQITLTDYANGVFADARCIGLIAGKDMLFWIQNKGSNWKNTFNGVIPPPVKDSYFKVSGIADGEYAIEWWDTYEGRKISTGKNTARNGSLLVDVPDFTKDTACKIRRKE